MRKTTGPDTITGNYIHMYMSCSACIQLKQLSYGDPLVLAAHIIIIKLALLF